MIIKNKSNQPYSINIIEDDLIVEPQDIKLIDGNPVYITSKDRIGGIFPISAINDFTSPEYIENDMKKMASKGIGEIRIGDISVGFDENNVLKDMFIWDRQREKDSTVKVPEDKRLEAIESAIAGAIQDGEKYSHCPGSEFYGAIDAMKEFSKQQEIAQDILSDYKNVCKYSPKTLEINMDAVEKAIEASSGDVINYLPTQFIAKNTHVLDECIQLGGENIIKDSDKQIQIAKTIEQNNLLDLGVGKKVQNNEENYAFEALGTNQVLITADSGWEAIIPISKYQEIVMAKNIREEIIKEAAEGNASLYVGQSAVEILYEDGKVSIQDRSSAEQDTPTMIAVPEEKAEKALDEALSSAIIGEIYSEDAYEKVYEAVKNVAKEAETEKDADDLDH